MPVRIFGRRSADQAEKLFPSRIHPFTLRFSHGLERVFLKDYFDSSIGLMRLSFLLGLLYYSFFYLLDIITLPEVKDKLALIRFGLVVPVIALTFLLSFTKGFIRWWQLAAVINTYVAGLGIIMMTVISPELGRTSYHPGMMLVLIYCYMLIRLRFVWASIAGWAIFLSYALSLFLYPGLSKEVVLMNLFFIGSANILGMFGGYALEYFTRKDFFSRHLLKLEGDKVRKSNLELEDRVREKTSELVRAKDRAEESDRLKSAFLANMSHEIRTPMNGILGFMNMLQEPDFSSAEKAEFIDIINKSGKRLLETVNDLIDISRIESGQVQTSYTVFNINDKLAEVVGFFRPEAANKGLDIKFETGLEHGKAFVRTDENKVLSVLTNLIKNALKYTDQGEVLISYTLRGNNSGKSLEFIVQDTGMGIPEDRIDAIFNRFEQADIEDSKAMEGSGLGLSIAQAYVEMLGGSIWVTSREGEGSCFGFEIPYMPGDKKETSMNKVGSASGATEPGSLKLLIVEDDEVSALFLKSLLEEEVRGVIFADSGLEAIEIVRRTKDIDLVLMDLKMPGIDGLEATRRIREFNAGIPIIAQTAFALSGDRAKAMDAGCDEYISKPIDQEELFKKIEAVMAACK